MYEELNKKLTKFVGIEYINCYRWLYPDGTYHKQSPDFPNSLDACFKWLVPKVDKLFEIGWKVGDYWLCMLVRQIENESVYTTAEAETPALALCLAIEKLIDGGG